MFISGIEYCVGNRIYEEQQSLQLMSAGRLQWASQVSNLNSWILVKR